MSANPRRKKISKTRQEPLVQEDPKKVLRDAFAKLEENPLLTRMKQSGEYERLVRSLHLPPPPTRTAGISTS